MHQRKSHWAASVGVTAELIIPASSTGVLDSLQRAGCHTSDGCSDACRPFCCAAGERFECLAYGWRYYCTVSRRERLASSPPPRLPRMRVCDVLIGGAQFRSTSYDFMHKARGGTHCVHIRCRHPAAARNRTWPCATSNTRLAGPLSLGARTLRGANEECARGQKNKCHKRKVQNNCKATSHTPCG